MQDVAGEGGDGGTGTAKDLHNSPHKRIGDRLTSPARRQLSPNGDKLSTRCHNAHPVMPAHLCHARAPLSCPRTPLSCCAQSQHPEMLVEHSEPGVPGLCDYARNDKVEDPTLCGEYRDVMLRAVAASRNACRTL